MIARAGSGWQTTTADLALILFLITAQAVREEKTQRPSQFETEQSASGEDQTPSAAAALALHKPAHGESISEWLLAAVTDKRQVATITVSYTKGQRSAALAEGGRLLEEAEASGTVARLIALPDVRDETVVAIDFLRDGEDGTNLAY